MKNSKKYSYYAATFFLAFGICMIASCAGENNAIQNEPAQTAAPQTETPVPAEPAKESTTSEPAKKPVALIEPKKDAVEKPAPAEPAKEPMTAEHPKEPAEPVEPKKLEAERTAPETYTFMAQAAENPAPGPEAQAKYSLRWKWKADEFFMYEVAGTLTREERGDKEQLKSFAENISTLIIRPESAERASFTQLFRSINMRERGVPYSAAEEELGKMTLVFYFGADSKPAVGSEKAADYLAGLFPLPPGSVAVGEKWDVAFSNESNLGGWAMIEKIYPEDGKSTARIMFEFRSKTNQPESKIIEGYAFFLLDEGRFSKVTRVDRIAGKNYGEVRGMDVAVSSAPGSENEFVKASRRLGEIREALKAKPADLELKRELSKTAMAAQEYDLAADTLEQLVKADGKDFKSRTLYAGVLLLIGDAAAAKKHFEAALAEAPDYAPALLGLGDAAMRIGEFEKAESLARAVLSKDSASYKGWYLLGIAQGKLRKEKEAKEAIAKYLRYNPTVDRSRERAIFVTPDGDIRIQVKEGKGVHGDSSPISDEDLERARELLRSLLAGEGKKLALDRAETGALLDYAAKLYGKSSAAMLEDFVKDKEATLRAVVEKLAEKGRIDSVKAMASAAAAGADAEKFAGAMTLLDRGKALPMLEAKARETENAAVLSLALAEMLLPEIGAGREAVKKFDDAVLKAQALDDANALYDFLLAYGRLVAGKHDEALARIGDGLGRGTFSTRRDALIRGRLKVLDETGFDETMRASTAYSGVKNTFAGPLKLLGETLARVSEQARDENQPDIALVVAALVHSFGKFLDEHADRPAYYVLGLEIETRGLALMVEMQKVRAKESGDAKKDLAEMVKDLEQAEKRRKIAKAAFDKMEWVNTKTFQVLSITKSAEAEAWALKLIERELELYKKLETLEAKEKPSKP